MKPGRVFWPIAVAAVAAALLAVGGHALTVALTSRHRIACDPTSCVDMSRLRAIGAAETVAGVCLAAALVVHVSRTGRGN